MDSGFTIKKSFISEESVEEIKRKKQEEWDRAYANAETKPPEEVYDSRPLFERLAEQRTLKEEALMEAAKFSNLIHRIDDDEFDFLKTLDDDERKKKLEVLKEEQEELERYRKAVQEASLSAVPETTTGAGSTPATAPVPVPASTPKTASAESKPRKRDLQRDLLKSVIKKRRGSEGTADTHGKKSSADRSDATNSQVLSKPNSTPSTTTTTTTPVVQTSLGLVDYSDDDSD